MKRKNYYLIWCVFFIFLLLPTQFGCNKTEFELQPEQTTESDFERVEHQEQIGDGNPVYYYTPPSDKAELGGPVPWDIKYKADALPASPWSWSGYVNKSVDNGVLHLEGGGSGGYSYLYPYYTNATIETRMRIVSSGSAFIEIVNKNRKYAKFRLNYKNGTVNLMLNDEIFLEKSSSFAEEFHTYRITLTDTEVKVYVDGVLQTTKAPNTCAMYYKNVLFYCNYSLGEDYYWDYVYFTDNGAYVPVPTLLAEGDNWVLLNNDYDWPDYDEQTIYDHLTWAGKTVAKKSVANYWVKKKLLGDNIAKFFAKKVGVSGIIKYLFMNLPIVGDADEVKQVWVRESDGYTAIKDAGSTYHVDKYYGYFETATLIHHGDQHFDYKFIIYHGTVKIATAILLHEHCGIASSTMLIWDFDFRMNAPLDFYSIELRRKSPGEPDSEYVHYKSSIVQRYN